MRVSDRVAVLLLFIQKQLHYRKYTYNDLKCLTSLLFSCHRDITIESTIVLRLHVFDQPCAQSYFQTSQVGRFNLPGAGLPEKLVVVQSHSASIAG